jgi:DNA polymerase IV
VTARILLADADAFFVAVARMEDPQGVGAEPLVIVGGAPGSRGVVCSASYETRKFGVRSGMPIARALRLCPRALCVPVPRGACSRKSHEVRAVLERYTPLVEGASIDEWYLDMRGTEALYRHEPLAETAARMRAEVLCETGLSVSFGGGTNKLIAKLAVELAKPRPGNQATGVHVVAPGEEAGFMRRFELGEIPLVGPRFRERLARHGLRTVTDVLAYDRATLCGWLGERAGAWLHDRVRGIHDGEVHAADQAKSLSREDTFAEDIANDAELERELMRLVVRATGDLRDDGLVARTITVKLRDYDFTTRQASRTLPIGVSTDRVIFGVARDLLRKLRAKRRAPARLLGVALSSLSDDPSGEQLAMFAEPDSSRETERDRAVASAVDRLRGKYGRTAVVPGRLAEKRQGAD